MFVFLFLGKPDNTHVYCDIYFLHFIVGLLLKWVVIMHWSSSSTLSYSLLLIGSLKTPAEEQIFSIKHSPEELKVQASLGEEEFVILLEPHLAHSSVLEEKNIKQAVFHSIFMESLCREKHWNTNRSYTVPAECLFKHRNPRVTLIGLLATNDKNIIQLLLHTWENTSFY